MEPSADTRPRELHLLLEQRRSIRRLSPGPFTPEIKGRLVDAARLTPAAFNSPPWHVVLIHETRAAFWEVVEEGFRAELEGDRLERYLDRLDGFRAGVAIALIYEDTTIKPHLQDAWNISEELAGTFVQQSLGMLQLSLWLSLTADGLATSLQHWDWTVERRIANFVGLEGDQYRLAAAMPIGYPAETPGNVERLPGERVVSHERVLVPVTADSK